MGSKWQVEFKTDGKASRTGSTLLHDFCCCRSWSRVGGRGNHWSLVDYCCQLLLTIMVNRLSVTIASFADSSRSFGRCRVSSLDELCSATIHRTKAKQTLMYPHRLQVRIPFVEAECIHRCRSTIQHRPCGYWPSNVSSMFFWF